MSEYKISEESAEEQLGRFNEWYDIDPEDFKEIAKGNTSLQNAYTVAKRRLVRAIRIGRLEIREESSKKSEPTLIVEQTLQCPMGDVKKIVYKELTGALRASVQIEEGDNDTRKNYKTLAVISGEDHKMFYKLRRGDIGVADSLGFLFAQV